MSRPQKTMGLCVCSFLLVYMLFHQLFYLGYVPSASMEPTIHRGSYIFGTRLIRSLAPGDIIIFRHDHRTLTKRIAYAPGDVLPDGAINQSVSMDSRFWSNPFVHHHDIIAKYIF